MIHFLRHTLLAVFIMPTLVAAEDRFETSPKALTDVPFSDGLGLLRDGAELLMQDLFAQIEPALKGLEAFALELEAYDPPVVLPNGDILIRRKTPLGDTDNPKRQKTPLPHQNTEVDPMPTEDIDL